MARAPARPGVSWAGTGYGLRLITVGGLAFVGLHARTVLLISREALRLLDAKELLAIGAHELGHDYVWDDYAEARQRATRAGTRSWSCGATGSPSSRWRACVRIRSSSWRPRLSSQDSTRADSEGLSTRARRRLDERIRFLRPSRRLPPLALAADSPTPLFAEGVDPLNPPSTRFELSRSAHFTGHRLQPMFFPLPNRPATETGQSSRASRSAARIPGVNMTLGPPPLPLS